MAINLLSFLYYLSFLIYAWLVGFILYKNKESTINRVCALLISCFALWSFSFSFFNISSSVDTAKLWINIASLGWGSFASIAVWFFLVFTKRKKILNNKLIYPLFFLNAFTIPIIKAIKLIGSQINSSTMMTSNDVMSRSN